MSKLKKEEGRIVNGNLKKLLVCGDSDQLEVFGELLWMNLEVGYLVRASVSGGNIYIYICQYFVRVWGKKGGRL